MTTRFRQDGRTLDYTPGSAVVSGQVIVIGARVGVALADIAASATGPLAVEGVYTLPKLSTDVIAQGALVYWDTANSRITSTASGNTLAGYAAGAAGNGATLIDVKLNA